MDQRLDQILHQRGYIMANKHIKRYSRALAIMKMQNKTMMRYHYTPIRMA